MLETFTPLGQTWDDGGKYILKYTPLKDADNKGLADHLRELAGELVDILGLRWCGFNIEFRQAEDGSWKVIEVHARLGEDDDYYEHMGPEDPHMRLIEVLRGCI